jgi:hypothetical protein
MVVSHLNRGRDLERGRHLKPVNFLEKKIFKKISDFSKSFIGKRGFFTQI